MRFTDVQVYVLSRFYFNRGRITPRVLFGTDDADRWVVTTSADLLVGYAGLLRIGGLVVYMVGAWDSRHDGCEFNSRLLRQILGWVTVFGRANHLSISPNHPRQLSVLPSVG